MWIIEDFPLEPANHPGILNLSLWKGKVMAIPFLVKWHFSPIAWEQKSLKHPAENHELASKFSADARQTFNEPKDILISSLAWTKLQTYFFSMGNRVWIAGVPALLTSANQQVIQGKLLLL